MIKLRTLLRKGLKRVAGGMEKSQSAGELAQDFLSHLNAWMQCREVEECLRSPTRLKSAACKVFESLGRGLRSDFAELIGQIKTRALSNEELLQHEDGFIDDISHQHLDPSCLDALITLEKAALRIGLLRLASECRETLHLNIRDQLRVSCHRLCDRMVVDLQSVTAFREYLSISEIPERDRRDLVSYLRLIDLEYTGDTPRESVEQDNEMPEFKELIRGKEVAVVGPGVPSLPNGSEIDSFDLVVILGYIGRERLPTANICGSRADLSYYGDFNATQYSTLPEYSAALAELRVASFKSPAHKDRAPLSVDRKRLFERPSRWLAGTPFMAQNAIYDLALHAPKRLKLLNTDLFSSSLTHHDLYQEVPTCKSTLWWPTFLAGFSRHNLISNFRFTRALYEANRLEADRDLATVLQMKQKCFLERVQKFRVLQPREAWLLQS